MKKGIRIVIVEHSDLARQALSTSLTEQKDIQVIGEFGSAKQVFDQVGTLAPDIVLMDAQLDGVDGIEATRSLKRNGHHCEASVILMAEAMDRLVDALEAGASGFVLKEIRGPVLADTIRQVYESEQLPRQTGLVHEVELVIPVPVDALRLQSFIDRVEKSLSARVVQTVGSRDTGTSVTLSVLPTSLSAIVEQLRGIGEVANVEEGQSLDKQNRVFKQFKSFLKSKTVPVQRLLITFTQPEPCRELAMMV